MVRAERRRCGRWSRRSWPSPARARRGRRDGETSRRHLPDILLPGPAGGDCYKGPFRHDAGGRSEAWRNRYEIDCGPDGTGRPGESGAQRGAGQPVHHQRRAVQARHVRHRRRAAHRHRPEGRARRRPGRRQSRPAARSVVPGDPDAADDGRPHRPLRVRHEHPALRDRELPRARQPAHRRAAAGLRARRQERRHPGAADARQDAERRRQLLHPRRRDRHRRRAEEGRGRAARQARRAVPVPQADARRRRRRRRRRGDPLRPRPRRLGSGTGHRHRPRRPGRAGRQGRRAHLRLHGHRRRLGSRRPPARFTAAAPTGWSARATTRSRRWARGSCPRSSTATR